MGSKLGCAAEARETRVGQSKRLVRSEKGRVSRELMACASHACEGDRADDGAGGSVRVRREIWSGVDDVCAEGA